MFNIKNLKRQPSDLETEIARVIALMSKMDPDTDPAYGPLADQLVKLYKLKDVDNNSKKRVSADALVAAGGSLLGVVAIINTERLQVITTKALGFVMKSK